MHPEASDDTQAHGARKRPAWTTRPSSPRSWRSMATRPRACQTPLGLGGQARGTARRRQRVPGMGLPSPRGRAASMGLWGEEDTKRNRDTTRSVSGPRASQPLWQQGDGGGVYGRTLCRIRRLI
jgi:hypothetical protein